MWLHFEISGRPLVVVWASSGSILGRFGAPIFILQCGHGVATGQQRDSTRGSHGVAHGVFNIRALVDSSRSIEELSEEGTWECSSVLFRYVPRRSGSSRKLSHSLAVSAPTGAMKRVFPGSDDEGSPAARLRGPTQSLPGSTDAPELVAKSAPSNNAPQLVVPELVAPIENTPGSASDGATGPIADPATTKPWAEAVLLFDSEAPAVSRPALGSKDRPVRLHTIFSGTGAPKQALRDLGYHVSETSMAEIKPSAQQFLKANNLWTEECFFADAHPLVTEGAGQCLVHDDRCQIPAGEVDLFVAGFPCSPFSNQGQTNRSEEATRNHRDFHKSQWAVDYIARVNPKMVVLENVPKFAALAPSGAPGFAVRGVHPYSFCDELCTKLRQLGYGVSWSFLTLEQWVEASGGRVYVTAIKGEAPHAQEMADRVRQRIVDIQAWRSRSPPQPWTDALMKYGSLDWMNHGVVWSDQLPDDQASDAPELAGDAHARWKIEGEELRALLERSGRPYHQSRLWSDPSHGAVRAAPNYKGIPKPVTARKREILDLGLAYAYHREDVDEVSPRATEKLVGTLLADVSQNPARRPWANKLKRITTDSRWYSYGEDRLLAPCELFRIYGWSAPNVSGLTYAHAVDLLGDSMALHTLGVVLDSVICVCERSGVVSHDAQRLVAEQVSSSGF